MDSRDLNRLDSEKVHYNNLFEQMNLSDDERVVDDSWTESYHEYHGFGLRLLGDLQGRTVLNVGCGGIGDGHVTTWLAQQGAKVFGVDITQEGLRLSKEIAEFNNVSVELRLESAEKLSFPSDYFDKILAYGVIHHLDVDVGLKQLSRCLKKGGTLVAVEPWDGNPLLRFARKYLWYPQKNRTPLERPLGSKDMELFSLYFAEQELFYFELVGSLIRVFRLVPLKFLRKALIAACHKIDEVILGRFPSMKKYCRLFVGEFRKV